METEGEHGQAASGRVLALRVLGLILLLSGMYIHHTPAAHRYMILCAGCGLIQLAHLDFPKPQAIVGASRVSTWELEHQQSYLLVVLECQSNCTRIPRR
jgi:hypothetical protein